MFDLVFIDLDGTLLMPDGTISPRSRKALAALAEKHVGVILASGRSPRMVRRFQSELGLAGPAICYNGGLVSASPAGGILSESKLSPETSLAVLGFLRQAGSRDILCEADDRLTGELQEATLIQAKRERWGLAALPILPQYLQNGAHKFIVIDEPARNKVLACEIRHELRGRVDLIASAPDTTWLEIMPPGVSKAAAAELLCLRLGVELARTAAFGDAENDVALLRAAGLGVAMGNGDPRAKAAAKRIAPANDEDGLARVVEELLAAG